MLVIVNNRPTSAGESSSAIPTAGTISQSEQTDQSLAKWPNVNQVRRARKFMVAASHDLEVQA